MSEGIADAAFVGSVEAEADELAAHVRTATVTMADPDVDDMFDQVYVEPHRQVEDDKAAYHAYQDSFEPAQGA